MSATSRTTDLGLPEIVRFFLRHFWLIFGMSITFGILAIGVSIRMAPVYRAEIVLVSAEGSSGGSISSLLSNFGGLGRIAGLGGAQTRRKDEALAMLRSRAFVSAFIDANDGFAVMYPDSWDAEAGAWKISADAAPSSQDAYIKFTSSVMHVSENKDVGTISLAIELNDRSLAAQWANDIVSMLNENFRERVSTEAQGSMSYLNDELGKVSSVELRQVIHRLIEAQIETIMLTNVRKQFVFRVIDPAVVQDEDHYISPRRVLLAFIGLVFGGFIGLCIAAFRDAMRAGARAQAAMTD